MPVTRGPQLKRELRSLKRQETIACIPIIYVGHLTNQVYSQEIDRILQEQRVYCDPQVHYHSTCEGALYVKDSVLMLTWCKVCREDGRRHTEH